MRLFTGIEIASEVLAQLEELLKRLRPTARLKWSPVENLHITTKFIGDWPDARCDELIAELGGVPSPGPVPIAIRGLGWFPNPRSPRVFWAGIEAGPGLKQLAQATEKRLARLGVPVENRDFSPHLTLARIRAPEDLRRLREAIDALSSLDFGEFVADRFHLYSSELHPGGSRYRKLARFSLDKQ